MMELSKFKKVKDGDSHAVLAHPDGHQITIAKGRLNKKMRSQLDGLQMMAEGGEVKKRDYDMEEASRIAQSLNPFPSDAENKANFEATLAAAPNSPDPGSVNATAAMRAPAMESQPMGGPQASTMPVPGGSPASATLGPSVSASFETAQAMPDVGANPLGAESPKLNGMPLQGGIGGLQKGLSDQIAGINGMAKEQANQGKLEAQAIKEHEQKAAKFEADYNEKFSNLTEHAKSIERDIEAGHIDPNHYLNKLSGGQKIGHALGLIIGGLGGSDAPIKYLHDAINRDVDAQKSELGKKENLLSSIYRQMGNLKDSTQMLKVFHNEVLGNKLKQIAATSSGALEKQRALQLMGKLQADNAMSIQEIALRQSMMEQAKNGSVDPAKLVPLYVPKEHQAKAFAEIEAAENTKRMSDSILKAFEEATKENTIMKTGAGFLRTPGSVYALHQAMQPTFKDLEGTVRQAAMDNTFKNITPMPGDSDHTVAQKRASLHEYLQSKLSAPTARGYGVDLSKFGSTAPAQQEQIKVVNGIKYKRGPNGEAIRVN